jgi:CRISPR/Cas system Type II protein with McrA/HNH and RuvC-like nuclease domain
MSRKRFELSASWIIEKLRESGMKMEEISEITGLSERTIVSVESHEFSWGMTMPKAPKEIRDFIVKRQERKCYYCGHEFSDTLRRYRATIDHLVPQTRGGSNLMSNMVAACLGCNASKGQLTEDEFAEWAGNVSSGPVDRIY